MPKELHEIKGFHLGTISNPDIKDTPDDSNVTSENLDPVAEGKLQGIEDDYVLQTTGGFAITGGSDLSTTTAGTEDMSRFTDEDKEYWLLGQPNPPSSGEIRIIEDPYGTPSQTTLSSLKTVGTQMAMQPNNKEVHIGMGAASDTPPKWVGKVTHDQLGLGTPAVPYISDAELKSPNSFTNFHATVNSANQGGSPTGAIPDQLYGISWRGQYVYRMDIATGKTVGRSTWRGISTQGMCRSSDGNLWVLDWDSDVTKYYLSKISTGEEMLELMRFEVRFPKDEGGITGVNITDSLYNDGTIHTYEDEGYVSGLYYQDFPNQVGTAPRMWFHSYEANGWAESTTVRSNRIWNTDEAALHTQDPALVLTVVARMMHTGSFSGANPWVAGKFVNFTYTHMKMVMIDLPRGCPFFVIGRGTKGDSFIGIRGGIHYAPFHGLSVSPILYWGNGTGGQQSLAYCYNFSNAMNKHDMFYFAQHYNATNGYNYTDTGDIDGDGPSMWFGEATAMSGGTRYNDPTNPAHTLLADNFFGMCELWYPHSDLDDVKKRACTVDSWRGDIHTGGTTDQTSFLRAYRPVSTNFYFVNYDPDGSDTYLTMVGDASGVIASTLFFSSSILYNVDLIRGLASPYYTSGTWAVSGMTWKFNLFSGYSTGRWAHLNHLLSTPPNIYTNTITAILESNLSITFDEIEGTFEGEIDGKHFFKASMTYDGYQDSPLGSPFVAQDGVATLLPTVTDRKLLINVQIRNLAQLSKRVSHINIFSSHAPYIADGSPTGFYRLIENLKLDNSWALTSDTSTLPVWGDYYQRSFVWDGRISQSYDSLTGMSEELELTLPHYSLSTQLNNTLFIADCYHPQLEDAKQYIFKSQTYNFDQFDWSLDLLRLPVVPTAIASFNGRIYAFDGNTTYKIEPMNMYIEDTFEGVGCAGKDAVCVTEYGMCFADNGNIYLHNGQSPVPIGDAIITGGDSFSRGWHKRNQSYNPIITFDSMRNSYIIFFRDGDDKYACWSFNIRKNRWDRLSIMDENRPITVATIGSQSEVIVQDNTTAKLFGMWMGDRELDETKIWSWKSKKLTMGQDTQYKNFKRVRVSGNATQVIDTIKGSESNPPSTFAADGVEGGVWNITSDNKQKYMQYLIDNSDQQLDSIGTIFRRKSVK